MSAHERGGWSRIGSAFYGGQVALGCTCGWRSEFTEHHYQAGRAFDAHVRAAVGVTGEAEK